jgi:hypothetical protein
MAPICVTIEEDQVMFEEDERAAAAKTEKKRYNG